MFFLLSADEAAKAAEHAPAAQEQAAHHAPIMVKLVNHYFGEWAHHFEMKYTYPKWKWLLAKFGIDPGSGVRALHA